MTARWRKLLGTGVILAFMVAYIWAAAVIGEHVPQHWLAQLVYYVVAGTAWGAPLIPLVIWMNRGR
jgi:hypothetical protein